MHSVRLPFLLLLLGLVAACGGGSTSPPPTGEEPAGDPPWEKTLLDEFVADTTGFAYDLLWTHEEGGVQTHLLDVTSQIWRSSEEVDWTTWWHDVAIAWPDGATSDLATVVIFGGSNTGHVTPDDEDLEYLALIASLTGRPAIGIGQIPNQPITVLGSGGPRSEDHLVAATWDKVLETGDPTWSAYFAMTRGVVRCLDAAQAYGRGLGRPLDRFLVTGFSKRGAATYLTAAVDRRVVAMAPGVFDFLDFAPQAAHHLHVYGTPAPAVQPYAAFGLLDRFDDPAASALLDHSDPYVYRERFTMPKLLIVSPGDQFFLPDAMRFYVDDLPGDTLVRYLPNSDHSLSWAGGDLLELIAGVLAWHQTVTAGGSTPDLDWVKEGDRLTLTASPEPTEVKLWQATNAAARDFRLEAVGAIWTSTVVTKNAGGAYEVEVSAPPAGYTAFFLEATWPSEEAYTTQVYVTPDD